MIRPLPPLLDSVVRQYLMHYLMHSFALGDET